MVAGNKKLAQYCAHCLRLLPSGLSVLISVAASGEKNHGHFHRDCAL